MILYIGVSKEIDEGVFKDTFYLVRDVVEVDTTCHGSHISFLHVKYGWYNLNRDRYSFRVRENIDTRIKATEVVCPIALFGVNKG